MLTATLNVSDELDTHQSSAVGVADLPKNTKYYDYLSKNLDFSNAFMDGRHAKYWMKTVSISIYRRAVNLVTVSKCDKLKPELDMIW